MKRVLIVTSIIASLFLTSCASKSKTQKEPPTAQQNNTVVEKESDSTIESTHSPRTFSVNHSYLTEENVGEVISVKGKLQANGSCFTLTENAASKSRVTFVLEVTSDSLKTKLKELSGSTVTITGELTEASSTWTKKMKVLSVE